MVDQRQMPNYGRSYESCQEESALGWQKGNGRKGIITIKNH